MWVGSFGMLKYEGVLVYSLNITFVLVDLVDIISH